MPITTFRQSAGQGVGSLTYFTLNGPNAAQIDIRSMFMLIQPQFNPLILLGMKPELEYGGSHYGDSPIGMKFGTVPDLKGPLHTWQDNALFRPVVVSGAATAVATSITFSTTLPTVNDAEALQVSTYDIFETSSGEFLFVSAMNYTSGVATVVRGFAGTTAAIINASDKIQKVTRAWPEGSEIDFTKDANVPNRIQDYNYTTTVRTPAFMTRTALDSLYLVQQEDVRQLQLSAVQHLVNLEANTMWGRRSESLDASGRTMRTGDGIVQKIARDSIGTVAALGLPANDALVAGTVANTYPTPAGALSTMTIGQTTAFFSDFMFANNTNGQDKYLMCSAPFLARLHQLYPQSQFDKVERDAIGSFGAIVTALKTPYGTVRIVPQQQLTDRAKMNTGVVVPQAIGINPEAFRVGFMKKTVLQKDMQNPSADGKGWGYLTEIMTEVGATKTHSMLVGKTIGV